MSTSVNPRSWKKSRIPCTTSWRTRAIATCRRLRSQRCRCSKRNDVPCSLGVIGKSTLGPRISSPLACISNPPGARGSARTTPVTATEVSWVRAWNRSHDSGATSFFARTTCRYPLPSRTTMKAILPLERVVLTQPRTVTVSPTWRPSSAMVEKVMEVGEGGRT